MDEDYSQVVARLRKTFAGGKTRSIEWRRLQLQTIVEIVEKHEEEMLEALYNDLKKPKTESMLMELDYIKNDANYMYNNLSQWMKPVNVSKGMVDTFHDCHYQAQPYGVALVLGAWNYPIQLVFAPLIGAIAAGNCAIVKPSELSPASASLLAKLIPQYLDNECIAIINGGIPETTQLLKEQFDVIFYTGSNIVAKIIMKAAAEHLTPVVLELGGKSPVYVDEGCDLSVVARRIMWGKCVNSGQTCLAPDYILCSQQVQDELIKTIGATLLEFYGDNIESNKDYARIISPRHIDRLSDLLKDGDIQIGGRIDKDKLFVEPTLVTGIKPTHAIMQEEIFGPILPILTVNSTSEAVEIINSLHRPLALYIFSNNKKTIDDIVENTNSGGVCINDTIVHAAPATLPFGGVGHSGMGCYHGKFSFDAFSYKRSTLHKDLKMEMINAIRYPPFCDKKLGWITWLLRKKQKRTGMLSFLPFIVTAAIAVTVKTMTFMG